MQLEGTLESFSLRELIEMAVYSSVSGVLELLSGDTIGRVYFRDGLPHHAECGDLAGFEALGRLFAERAAPFRFQAGGDVSQSTLWMDPWELIERAEHQSRSWLPVLQHVPSLRYVPVLLSRPGAEQILIGEDVWPVLAAVDGQRNLVEIARALELPVIDICTAMITLLRQRLVVLQPPRPVADEPPIDEGAAPARDGFFERLIARTLEQERRGQLPHITTPRISEPRSTRPVSDPQSSDPTAPQQGDDRGNG